MIFISLISLSLLTILLLILANCLFWSKVRHTEASFTGLVSVLIPVRNEEENLENCLNSVFLQGKVVKEIIVYDDHSTDRTAAILSELSAQIPNLYGIPVKSLPAGWCGKNFACAQLGEAATGDWLLFLDADARLAPNAINRIFNEATIREVTFLSCWPHFEMLSLAEKLLMPMLNFVVFSLFPGFLSLRKESEFSTNPGLGLAHGACLFFEKKGYIDFGGHERVKDQIFEDTRIAQLWRFDQRKGICLDGQEVVSVRMYKTFGEIWAGFQKNFYPAFKKDSSFWLFILFHFSVFLLPFFLLITISYKWGMSVFLIYMCRLALAFRFKHSFISILFHPLSQIFLLILGLSSYFQCKSGRGVQWKGREYLTRT